MIEQAMQRVALPFEAESREGALALLAITDFYASFYLGQGEPDVQGHYLDLVAGLYASSENSDQLHWITTNSALLGNLAVQLLLPSWHGVPTKSDERGRERLAAEYRRQWDVFNYSLHSPQVDRMPNRLISLANALIDVDLMWVKRGRFRLLPGTDLHSSMVRDHVVEGQPLGRRAGQPFASPTFDSIRPGLLDACFSNPYNTQLFSRLAVAWEKYHPGQVFVGNALPGSA